MLTEQEILLRAAQFVRQGWTKGAPARDKSGVAVFSTDDTAVSWCMLGAIYLAEVGEYETPNFGFLHYSALGKIGEVLGDNLPKSGGIAQKVTTWNDRYASSADEVATILEEAANRV